MSEREKMEGPWKLWDGWGPHKDGLMRVSHIGPSVGGLRAYDSDGLSPVDIQGTREDLELVINAVNAYLAPQRERDREMWVTGMIAVSLLMWIVVLGFILVFKH